MWLFSSMTNMFVCIDLLTIRSIAHITGVRRAIVFTRNVVRDRGLLSRSSMVLFDVLGMVISTARTVNHCRVLK